jgi:hypothetical protein
LWLPLDPRDDLEVVDLALEELAPGFPWHALKVELDEEGEGIELELQIGEALWRHLAGPDEEGRAISFVFEAGGGLDQAAEKRALLETAALGALAAAPDLEILLENMHGLKVDPGGFVKAKHLAALFEGVRSLEGVPWNLLEDGCGERAMIAGAWLRSQEVRPVKVFVVGELELVNDERSDRTVEWGFHVAPGVFVQDRTGHLELRILDPAIADRPLTVAGWLGRFAKGPVVIDVLPWFQRNAVEWGGFERAEDVSEALEEAWQALEEVVEELRREQSARSLEQLQAERAQVTGGQRPALSY